METLEQASLVFATTLGFTEWIKTFIPKRYRKMAVPPVAVLMGIGTNIYWVGYSPEIVLQGAIIGFTTSGIYKAVQSSLTPKK